jgi:hypothetical protein
MVILDKQELIRVSLAAEDMNLPCHGSTRCPTEPIKPSQSAIVKALSAIGNPRYEGTFLTVQSISHPSLLKRRSPNYNHLTLEEIDL